MKNISFVAAFILEIVAFIGFSSLGFLFPIAHIFQIALFVIFFLVLIAYWSLYMSPKASKKLKEAPYYVSKLLIYGLAAFVILQTQNQSLGLLFVFAVIVNEMLLFKHNIS